MAERWGEYGVATVYDFTLVTAGSQDLQASPTLATGDVTISKDDGSFVNLATLPTTTPAGGVKIKVSVSATEMQAERIFIRFKDAAGAEWDENALAIVTYGHPSSKHPQFIRLIGKREIISSSEHKEYARDGSTLLTTWVRTTPGGVPTWTPTHA